jgi:hypothetical protein
MKPDSIRDAQVSSPRAAPTQIEDIAHALREDIIFGRLAPGTRLVLHSAKNDYLRDRDMSHLIVPVERS